MLFSRLVLSLLTLLSISFANKQEKYVKVSFDKTYGTNLEESSSIALQKRDNFDLVDITSHKTFYSVNLAIGTPSQNVTVLLDTGSSDLWVMGSGYCNADSCSDKYGVFDSSSSSTFHNNNTNFFISYGDETVANGTWSTDTVAIGSDTLNSLSFAVASFTNSTIGVLGVGYSGLETTFAGKGRTSSYQYENLPVVMKNQGIIDQLVFSLYLDDTSGASGDILFGAVDHSKYSGTLHTVPLVNFYASAGLPNPVEFDITLYGVGYQDSKSNTTFASTMLPALLDSGTTFVYFPSDLLNAIANGLSATYDSSRKEYVMTCPTSTDNSYLAFNFGGFNINVPMSDFIEEKSYGCRLLMGEYDGRVILGDVFLKNAYVVYDLDNYEVSMAQADFTSSSSSNIDVINENIPSAIKAASYTNVWTTDVVQTGGDIFAAVYSTESGASVNTTSATATANGSSSGTTSFASSAVTGTEVNSESITETAIKSNSYIVSGSTSETSQAANSNSTQMSNSTHNTSTIARTSGTTTSKSTDNEHSTDVPTSASAVESSSSSSSSKGSNAANGLNIPSFQLTNIFSIIAFLLL